MKKKRRNSDVTRAHILDAAFLEIYRHGYHGVGVRNLAAKADVTIGAFFHHFPTKNHVVYAIVEEIIRPGICGEKLELREVSQEMRPVHCVSSERV